MAGAVGVAGEGEDLGVVDEAVDHGCGDDVVGEGLAPAAEGKVRGDHDGPWNGFEPRSARCSASGIHPRGDEER